MLWDNHMHSSFSGDSEAAPIDMINAARARGLRGMTFTDHLDIDYKEEPGLFDLNIADYYEKQHALALEQSEDEFTVLTGIEIGLQPHVADQNRQAVTQAPFDYVIGSTHVVDGRDPYYEAFWKQGDTAALCRRYYENILENISCYSDFDALGHLDYMFRYHPVIAERTNSHQPYADVIDAILEKIIAMDKALEINMGALKKGLAEPNPCVSIIKRYHELGGRLITLGADAHEPAHVALGYEGLPELLKQCGYREFAVYIGRVAHMAPV